MLREVRVARLVDAIGRHRSGALSCIEAAEELGISERHCRRLRDRCEVEGAEGLIDRRLGRRSPKLAPVDELRRMRAPHQRDDEGFTLTHFHEKLVQCHGYKLGDTTTRLYLQKTGAVQPAPDPSTW